MHKYRSLPNTSQLRRGLDARKILPIALLRAHTSNPSVWSFGRCRDRKLPALLLSKDKKSPKQVNLPSLQDNLQARFEQGNDNDASIKDVPQSLRPKKKPLQPWKCNPDLDVTFCSVLRSSVNCRDKQCSKSLSFLRIKSAWAVTNRSRHALLPLPLHISSTSCPDRLRLDIRPNWCKHVQAKCPNASNLTASSATKKVT